MSEFKIGQHNIEIKYSGTGSFSPWHHKAYEEAGIKGLICTADVKYFIKIDDDIYRIEKSNTLLNENPNLEECGKQVLDDFSNKILTIFKENLYGMKKRRTHCQIYDEINRRWFRFYESIPITYECKKILKLTNSQDNIGKYVLDYILDYMSHNYLGRNVKEPTLDDINNWCGNGEFPFLEVYLIRNADGVVSLAYYLAR